MTQGLVKAQMVRVEGEIDSDTTKELIRVSATEILAAPEAAKEQMMMAVVARVAKWGMMLEALAVEA